MAAELLEQILPYLRSAIYPYRQTISDWRMKEGEVDHGESVSLNDKSWTPIRLPFVWGKDGRTFWFRTHVALSEQLVGKPVVLLIGFENALLFLDGKPYHGVNRREREILLTQKGHARQTFRMAAQAVSGRSHLPQTFEPVELAALNPTARGLFRGLSALHELDKLFDHGTQESRDIRELVRRTLIYLKYFKPEGEEYPNAIARAYNYLLKAVDSEFKSSLSGLISLIGHDQVDVGWTEGDLATAREVGRKFSTALRTMEELPDYRFTSSQAYLYALIQDAYPEVFKQVKQRVAEGRWEPAGPAWVECDTSMPSGESLVRQFLYGKRYFLTEFGVDSAVAWFPSQSGFTPTLPQILVKSGIRYLFSTAERRNEGGISRPPVFRWRGLDGSTVLVHESVLGLKGRIYPQELHAHASLFGSGDEKPSLPGAIQLFGFGSDAGPSVVEQVDNFRVLRSITGLVPSKITSAAEFFSSLEAGEPELQTFEGNLAGEVRNGIYASGAKVKTLNRRLESLLFMAELCGVLSSVFGKQRSFRKYALAALELTWKKTLVNQTPNIIGGTAPKEAMAAAQTRQESAETEARKILAESLRTLSPGRKTSSKEHTFAVFNPTPWARHDYVELAFKTTDKFFVVTDNSGEEIEYQILESGSGSARLLCYLRNVPAFSFVGLTIRRGISSTAAATNAQPPSHVIETPLYRIRMDHKGSFSSIYHKRLRRDIVPKGKRINLLQTFQDAPSGWDARDFPRDYERHRADIFSLKGARIVRAGPLRTTVRYDYRSPAGSLLSQEVHFYHESDLIEFRTWVKWKEKHVLLKVAMPLNVKSTSASFEIPFGVGRRSMKLKDEIHLPSKSEAPGLHWVDVSESRFGVSVVTDSIYGWDAAEAVLRLTLLRAPSFPDPQDPRKPDDGYIMDQGEHQFAYAVYPHQGDWKKAGTVRRAQEFCHPLLVVEDMTFPAIPSLCEISKSNIMIDAVKKAEDTDEVIVRLHEAHGETTDTTVRFSSSVKRLTECDLIERETKPLRCVGNKLSLRFKPFEIKTLKVQFRIAGKR